MTSTARAPRLTFADRVTNRRWRLRPASPLSVEPMRVPMRDGVTLRADVYHPAAEAHGTILIRTPYGPKTQAAVPRQLAAHGYRTVVTYSRGTFGSGGSFDPMRTEAQDGQDVVAWLRLQPWYTGSFATTGASYIGYTQWALFSEPPEDLRAAVIFVGPHDFAGHTWSTGTFRNDLISWSNLIDIQETASMPKLMIDMLAGNPRAKRAMRATPVVEGVRKEYPKLPWLVDRVSDGDLASSPWAPTRFESAIEKVDIPILLITGWQDIFRGQSHLQYQRLRQRGTDVALSVGPWTHLQAAGNAMMHNEMLQWFDTKYGRLDVPARQAAVHLEVTGGGGWRWFASWPPATRTLTLHPNASGRLGTEPAAGERTFVYSPDDPTPSVGGNDFAAGGYKRDDRLAARSDVLTFDSDPMAADTEVMGVPVATIDDRTEHADADLFVRISDVAPNGHSTNVTDGYLRLREASGATTIELDAVAHRFATGHRIRLIVAGGAFPLYAINPGTGENPTTATVRVANRHTVSLAGTRIDLPVVGAR
ncbi:CocE/NonD family hydrolase [Streptomyces sp. H49]|uniref:CocE/NonD family hydrolase n=1 Tax=Streptomyces sp. H49 TaxID=3444117 RepID=UPI003F4A8D29